MAASFASFQFPRYPSRTMTHGPYRESPDGDIYDAATLTKLLTEECEGENHCPLNVVRAAYSPE